jgi:phenolic acid decarboxylase
VEHLDQLYSRLYFALYHVLWRAQQEKLYASMEYALHSRIVVDRRVDSHGVTLDRMSINIRKITPCSQRGVAKALSFRGVNGTYVLMDIPAVHAETI